MTGGSEEEFKALSDGDGGAGTSTAVTPVEGSNSPEWITEDTATPMDP